MVARVVGTAIVVAVDVDVGFGVVGGCFEGVGDGRLFNDEQFLLIVILIMHIKIEIIIIFYVKQAYKNKSNRNNGFR